MKNLIVSILISSAMTIAYAQPAPPEGAGDGPGRGGGRMMQHLKLTDEQQDAIGKLRTEHQKQQIALRAKIATARVDLRQIMQADKPDQAAIIAKQNEVTALQGQMKTARTQFWFDVNAKLTPEQQKTWKQMLHRGMMARESGDRHHPAFRRGGMMHRWREPVGDTDDPEAPSQPE